MGTWDVGCFKLEHEVNKKLNILAAAYGKSKSELIRLVLKSFLESHSRGGLKVTLYKCPVCGEVFPNLRQLQEHFRVAHISGLKCPVCGKELSSETSIAWHALRMCEAGDMDHCKVAALLVRRSKNGWKKRILDTLRVRAEVNLTG